MNKLLILGDLIIDKTIYVEAHKLSPEGPYVACNLLDKDPIITPGGAGLAASYAQKKNIPYEYLYGCNGSYNSYITNENRRNIIGIDPVTKTRYIDIETGYHLLRVDSDKIANQKGVSSNYLLDYIQRSDENYSCIVCLDYNKGFFDTKGYTPQEIIKVGKEFDIPVYVDSRHRSQDWFGATTIKVNKREYFNLINYLQKKTNKTGKVSWIIEELNIENFIVTNGENGGTIHREKNSHHCPTPQCNGTPDITGCGDVFDINFCYYYYLKRYKIEESLEESIKAATLYAYTNIKTRLCN